MAYDRIASTRRRPALGADHEGDRQVTESKAAWDPDSYMAFADQRLRPGLDLITRIQHQDPRLIVDLGCGTGDLTAALARRWPLAQVLGIDESAEMLEKARSKFPPTRWPTISWERLEIAQWVSVAPVSILFSNAALHWLGEHHILFPRLMSQVESDGVLAVQMPDNWDEPSHRLIGELIGDPRWTLRAAPMFVGDPVARPSEYRAWLQPAATGIDQWRTTYFHVLEGEDPVLDWVKGSILRPILAVLEPNESEVFLSRLGEAYRSAYPAEPDRKTILPFSRLFLVATRG